MRSVIRTRLWFALTVLLFNAAFNSLANAASLMPVSSAISATATVDLPLGLVSSDDTSIVISPAISSPRLSRLPMSSSNEASADSRWLLRLNSKDGFVLKINGDGCEISRLQTAGSPFVRYVDLNTLCTSTLTRSDSLVISLISVDN
ncbi:MAG TPA: hypothetical protein VJ983_04450 [candidate division Zixibacteria bacterium]|nr:hypothetical protein [candidate division Zixibacteria bacterium]